jgi:glutamine phosphoribosylpyrophosphate amidotransferase
MCGLFGMILPHRYPTDLLRRDAALAFLGVLAEERGRHGAGIAALLPTADQPDGRWVVKRHPGTFTDLIGPRRLRGLVNATAAIGHTRWATQGAITMANTSPLQAGSLLGTHNGDLDVDTIRHAPAPLDPTWGPYPSWTDSRVVYDALATAHTRGRVNTRRLVTILSGMRGRAALVWTDTADTTARGTGRVWLARAGLSPLAIAHDVDGGLWWASNPEWLRRLSCTFGLPLRNIELLPEGVLMSATPQQSRIKVTVHARFKPTVRHQDLRLVRAAVWRNFTPADCRDDGAVMRHRVVGAGLSRPTHLNPQPSLV